MTWRCQISFSPSGWHRSVRCRAAWGYYSEDPSGSTYKLWTVLQYGRRHVHGTGKQESLRFV